MTDRDPKVLVALIGSRTIELSPPDAATLDSEHDDVLDAIDQLVAQGWWPDGYDVLPIGVMVTFVRDEAQWLWDEFDAQAA